MGFGEQCEISEKKDKSKSESKSKSKSNSKSKFKSPKIVYNERYNEIKRIQRNTVQLTSSQVARVVIWDLLFLCVQVGEKRDELTRQVIHWVCGKIPVYSIGNIANFAQGIHF